MKYINSNDYFNKIENPKKYNIEEVLLTGLAPGKGLFIPEKLVNYDKDTIKSFKNKSYSAIAFKLAAESTRWPWRTRSGARKVLPSRLYTSCALPTLFPSLAIPPNILCFFF